MADKPREKKALKPEKENTGTPIHFGNVKVLELRLLEANNKLLLQVVQLLTKLVEKK